MAKSAAQKVREDKRRTSLPSPHGLDQSTIQQSMKKTVLVDIYVSVHSRPHLYFQSR